MRLLLIALLLCATPALAGSTFNQGFGAGVGTDTIGNTVYPKTKLAFGADGAATDVSSSNPLPVTATIGSASGKVSVTTVRNDYTSVGVTSGAWLQLVGAMPAAASEISIFDSSGQTLELAVGAAGSEVRQVIIFPGGNGSVPIAIASGARVSVRAISATASTGELDINFLQ